MDYYLIVSRSFGELKNIGDYIQSLAARQYYQKVDGYIDREELSDFHSQNGQKVKAIMNGWYLWNPEKWPPSDDIIPLFVSIHLSPLVIKQVLVKKNYLIKYAPIGCRDYGTLNYLKEQGIESYFSGCLTLTLGKKYHFEGERKGVYFVDPIFPILSKEEMGFRRLLWLACHSIVNMVKILKLSKNDFFKYYGKHWGVETTPNGMKGFLKRLYKASLFYITYRTRFTDDVLLNATYMMHEIPVDGNHPLSTEDWLQMAEDFLKKYMSAQLVVTSRIHAALPSLSFETPVIFMTSERMESPKIDFNTPGRFDGIVDFFRKMTVKTFGIDTDDVVLNGFEKIDVNTSFTNKDNWRLYAKDLYEKCVHFMEEK